MKMKFRWKVKWWWRLITGRCVLCGLLLEEPQPKDLYSRWPHPRACRRCNKGLHWGRMYGMGSKKLAEQLGFRTDVS